MQTTDWEAMLRTRLFGYAVLFRAREGAGGVEPVEVTAAAEAAARARTSELQGGEKVHTRRGGGSPGGVYARGLSPNATRRALHAGKGYR